MTTPKKDYEISKVESPHRAAIHNGPSTTSPEGPAASTNMIAACDRLAEKLDELTSLIKNQVQTSQQVPESSANASMSPTVIAPSNGLIANSPQQSNSAALGSAPQIESANVSATSGSGTTNAAESTRRSMDAFARSQDSWQEQAEDFHHALDAIMDFLENQATAAASAPKVDVSEILNRLRNLEEEQQNLRSQMSLARWSPT